MSVNVDMDLALSIFFDVDNTLLDNDRAKRALDAGLAGLLGAAGAVRFWEWYEIVRRETGKVNIPLSMARYDAELESAAMDAAERRRLRFALADFVMNFPYAEFVFPGALDAIAHAQSLGRTAILSEGDPTFQPSKIWRSGLDNAARGNVLVFDRKTDHFAEVAAAFPADRYVLVEDKPDILQEFSRQFPGRCTTVLIRQGKYGRVELEPPLPDIVLDDVAQFVGLGASELIAAAT